MARKVDNLTGDTVNYMERFNGRSEHVQSRVAEAREALKRVGIDVYNDPLNLIIVSGHYHLTSLGYDREAVCNTLFAFRIIIWSADPRVFSN